MDVGTPPSVELRAAMEPHLPQPHHPSVVNLDTGDFGFAGQDRQSPPLKQREADVNVQAVRFETGQAIRHGDEFLAQARQILQPLVEAEILPPIDTHLHSQEGAELLVQAAHQVLAVDPQHVMAMVEFFEHAVQLAAQPFGDARPEEVGHLIGGQPEQSHFAGVLKHPVEGEVPLENEIPAVFDLVDRVVAA